MKPNILSLVLLEIIVLAASAESGPATASEASASQRPVNLLFIMCDQFRHDVMSCDGHTLVKTPNLDRLAREGTRFAKAYSQCPSCSPARATLLSGRSIYIHGITNNRVVDQANAQEPAANIFPMKTFDEILCAQGYRSEYVGKWHVPAYRGQCYIGFNDRDVRPIHSPGYAELLRSSGVPDRPPAGNDIRFCPALGAPSVLLPYRPNPLDTSFGLASGGSGAGKVRKRRPQPDNHGELLIGAQYTITAYEAGLTIRSIRELAPGPFSITCSFNWPHAPMLPAAPYAGMYPAEEMKPPASISDPMENSPYSASVNGRKGHPEYSDPEKIKYMMSDYYGLIKEIDDWVGKILDTLREVGAENNTLVVFTSDHGEMLGVHGMREKAVFYEESVRVPLLMRLR